MPSATTAAGRRLHLNAAGTNSFGKSPTPNAKNTSAYNTYISLTGGFRIPEAGGNAVYLAGMRLQSASFGQIMMYQRLAACSGFAGNTASTQSITGSLLAESGGSSGGDGCQIALEGVTAIQSGAANVTVSYTNTSGTSGRTTVSEAIIPSLQPFAVQILRLQAGDTGVRSVQSLTLSASTGNPAGNFSVSILRPLGVHLPVSSTGQTFQVGSLGSSLVPLRADPSAGPDTYMISFLHHGQGSTTGTIVGDLTFVYG